VQHESQVSCARSPQQVILVASPSGNLPLATQVEHFAELASSEERPEVVDRRISEGELPRDETATTATRVLQHLFGVDGPVRQGTDHIDMLVGLERSSYELTALGNWGRDHDCVESLVLQDFVDPVRATNPSMPSY